MKNYSACKELIPDIFFWEKSNIFSYFLFMEEEKYPIFNETRYVTHLSKCIKLL